MADNATLTVGNTSYDLQVIKGTTGPDVIDVRKLYDDAGGFTFDPGFTSPASCESKIPYIDGDAGILLHRGYPIEQLAKNSSFLEVCYLLLNGELPTAAEFADFEHTITYHSMIHAQFDRFFTGFRPAAPPSRVCPFRAHPLLPLDDPRAVRPVLHRLPLRRAPDGDHDRRGRRALG